MRLLASLLLTALTLAGLAGLQPHIDAWRLNSTAKEEILYVPTGEYVKTAVLGFDGAAADLLWVRGIILFGDHYGRDADPTWLEFMLRIIEVCTELDPLDHRIYLYGGIMLQLHDDYVDDSTRIFLKGMENVDHFFMPFGVAMNALEFEGDREKAARYMKIAVDRRDAPFYLRSLVASLLSDTGQAQAGLMFLEEQLHYLEPGSLEYKEVNRKIKALKYEIFQSRLQDARARFQTAFGRDPDPLAEMVGVTLKMPGLPPDPYGGTWVIQAGTGNIVSTKEPKKVSSAPVKHEVPPPPAPTGQTSP